VIGAVTAIIWIEYAVLVGWIGRAMAALEDPGHTHPPSLPERRRRA
jgi:hypothetical protein